MNEKSWPDIKFKTIAMVADYSLAEKHNIALDSAISVREAISNNGLRCTSDELVEYMFRNNVELEEAVEGFKVADELSGRSEPYLCDDGSCRCGSKNDTSTVTYHPRKHCPRCHKVFTPWQRGANWSPACISCEILTRE
jgi:hypothetical protein